MGEPVAGLDYERRLLQVTAEALELPQAERRPFVEAAARDRPGLAREVLALLATEDSLGEFLEYSPVRARSGAVEHQEPADPLGRARLLAALGRALVDLGETEAAGALLWQALEAYREASADRER
jgi:hypothetical protein